MKCRDCDAGLSQVMGAAIGFRCSTHGDQEISIAQIVKEGTQKQVNRLLYFAMTMKAAFEAEGETDQAEAFGQFMTMAIQYMNGNEEILK